MKPRNGRDVCLLVHYASLLGFSTAGGQCTVRLEEAMGNKHRGREKRGEVVIYGPHNPMYQQLWAVFQKSFPELKFNFVPGKGADH